MGLIPKNKTRGGVKVPLIKNLNGFFTKNSFVESVKRSMLVILLTKKGERVHNPNFGSRIHELLFEPSTLVFNSLIKEYIIDALVEFEKDIEITNIIINKNTSGNSVDILIEFVIVNNSSVTESINLLVNRDLSIV